MVRDINPLVTYYDPRGDIESNHIATPTVYDNQRVTSRFCVVVLPHVSASKVYVKIKHFGDVKMGVQRSSKTVTTKTHAAERM
ncbi:hypothetical protein BDZ94DRAFT_1257387 [Collybia nuda]|uniref:Uncharacterized protein n=1 Tax=Collybia nuda TaxID=64659 RepID=A0A9P6CFI8_9AGAR|nr:hypothetical protein BDZ94DRAFT_1257387 [Collybia nuda]